MFRNFVGLLILTSVLFTSCVDNIGRDQIAEPTDVVEPVTLEAEPTKEPTLQPDTNLGFEATPEPIENDPGLIKVGYMGPLTGGASFLGAEQLSFAKTVVKVFSQQTGLQIEIIEADTQINPDIGVVVANQFANDPSIIGVIGPSGSQVCEATQPIFETADLAHITPSCTKTDLTTPGTSTFFRPIPTDANQSRSLAAHMIVATKIRTLFIVDDGSSYASVLSDELTLLLIDSGVRVRRSTVSPEETNFSPIVTTIIESEADAVFMVAQSDSQTSTLAIELDQQGYDGFYYLPDTGFVLNWVKSAGTAAENTYVSFFAPDPNLVPEASEYNAVYREDFGPDFGALGGAAGLATEVLLKAIEVCARTQTVTRVCVIESLRFIELKNTMLGIPIKFGEGNQAGGGFSLFQIQNGDFKLLSGVADPGNIEK